MPRCISVGACWAAVHRLWHTRDFKEEHELAGLICECHTHSPQTGTGSECSNKTTVCSTFAPAIAPGILVKSQQLSTAWSWSHTLGGVRLRGVEGTDRAGRPGEPTPGATWRAGGADAGLRHGNVWLCLLCKAPDKASKNEGAKTSCDP